MCGILGHISTNDIDLENFETLLAKLHHRGPDDSGTYFYNNNIALGQTRLSIIDLSKDGHQPMISRCNNFVIVFNGEIYNYNEIRRDLTGKNYSFFSTSDTEVILNGYIEYRQEIVKKLNGMFAFAIYDLNKNELFIARDRSGIKPLYYCHKKNNFIFSSEIKPLKEFDNQLDIDSKILCLMLGSVPEPNTIYKNIKSFPAGYYGYFTEHKLVLRQFDKYEFSPEIKSDYKKIISNVKHLLHNSVKRHLISDAPIGTFLSGGLDSSAITAIAAQYKTDLNTLSLIFDEKKYSEESYQDLIVQKYNTNHTKYLISEEYFLNSVEDFLQSLDQPTCDGMNTFLVSKAAHEIGLKTVLSGLGGDEIFYGYPSFRLINKLKLTKLSPLFFTHGLGKTGKFRKLNFLKQKINIKYYLPVRGIFLPEEIAEIMNMEQTQVENIIYDFFSQNYLLPELRYSADEAAFYELNLYMKNQLLRDSDVFGMANSLEIRVPFLDKDLVDYVLRIPPKLKLNSKINKNILADAVTPYVPPELFKRKKMGFTMPFDSWIRSNLDEFGFNREIKKKFIENKMHWSRVWLLYILNRF